MSATHSADSTTPRGGVLYLALELGQATWKLAFTTGGGQPARLRTIVARHVEGLRIEIRKAKQRFGLPEDAPVVSCYEAGRDGFWLHRFLLHEGVKNIVVDSASIEVNRRRRRAKSDRLDAVKLASMLVRHDQGEKHVWSVVHVPTVEDEDHRQLHRELSGLKAERTALTNQIKGLLASLGLSAKIDVEFPERLEKLCRWDGAGVPPEMRQRLLRAFERWRLIIAQIAGLEARRKERLRDRSEASRAADPSLEQVRRLMELKGVGPNSAWLLVREVFGWRRIRNRRELASLAGLVPTPYASGSSHREQGISKAGNRRVRCMMIELAWLWLRYQPGSELSRWFQRRWGEGHSRSRKTGITALARKLLIALWKYLETGAVPPGAELREGASNEGARKAS